MQRNQIILVAAGVLGLGAVSMAVVKFGRDEATVPPAHGGEGATNTASTHATGAEASTGHAAAIRDSGEAPSTTDRGDPTVTHDRIGGTAGSDVPGDPSPSPATSLSAGAATDSTPMAVKGRSLGIDTDMDDDWAPESEAAQWFDSLDAALDGASPLDPDSFSRIMGDHRETTIDVFKRSGEIAEAKGPDAGLDFLDEWNALVEDYKREAYGKPTAD